MLFYKLWFEFESSFLWCLDKASPLPPKPLTFCFLTRVHGWACKQITYMHGRVGILQSCMESIRNECTNQWVSQCIWRWFSSRVSLRNRKLKYCALHVHDFGQAHISEDRPNGLKWREEEKKTKGYPWIPMHPLMSMDIHVYPWTAMYIHGPTWTLMDVHRYAKMRMSI